MGTRTDEDDIWTWRPSGPPCTEKHVWVYYHSMRIRECTCCGARENLWANFGLAPTAQA